MDEEIEQSTEGWLLASSSDLKVLKNRFLNFRYGQLSKKANKDKLILKINLLGGKKENESEGSNKHIRKAHILFLKKKFRIKFGLSHN